MTNHGIYKQALVISLLCLSAAAFCGIGGSSEKPETVKIGAIIPLTGRSANIGRDMQRILSEVEELANRRSTRYRYKFVIDDGQGGLGKAATTIAKKFIEVDNIKFLITGGSGETLQAGPLAERRGVLTIAAYSNHKDIKHLGDYIFRTFIDIEQGMKLIASRIEADRAYPLAALSEENAFTLGMREILEQLLGEKILLSEEFKSEESDFRALLLRAKSRNPAAYYFNAATPKTFSLMLRQAKELGIKEPVYTHAWPSAPMVRESLGELLEGVVYTDVPHIEKSSAEFRKVLDAYHRKYPEGPVHEFMLRTTFDAAMSIINGVEAVGPDPKAVKDFLYQYEAPGALGTVAYDRNGDIKTVQWSVSKVSW